MSWHRNRLRLPRLIMTAIVALSATAAAANILVVRSSGPSAKAYPPGRSLAPNARVVLRPGDSIILLDGRGTRTLRGPGNFAAGAAAAVTTRSALTVNNGGRIGRIGASRTAEDAPRRPSIWHVDVSQSGNVCIADPRHVLLWRPNATQTVSLGIAGGSGATRTTAWTAGQSTLAWPADLNVAEGADYRLSIPGVTVPTRLRFKVLPAVPATVEAQAEAFIRNGCQAQLDALIEAAPTAG